jgi:hypothetical protein
MPRPRSLWYLSITRLIAVAALAAAAFAASNVLAATPTVSTESVQLGVGQSGQSRLRALNVDPPGVGAWTVDVTYNPAIITIVDCEPYRGGLCNASYRDDKIRTNGVEVLGVSGNITLATIEVSCKAVGTSPLSVSISVFADTTAGNPQPIETNVGHGQVVCSEEPPESKGDVDCDGDVDSIDAALVLQYDARLTATLPCLWNADVNHDGDINSIDGTIILQIAAGLV